jgi:hypothetical protein
MRQARVCLMLTRWSLDQVSFNLDSCLACPICTLVLTKLDQLKGFMLVIHIQTIVSVYSLPFIIDLYAWVLTF